MRTIRIPLNQGDPTSGVRELSRRSAALLKGYCRDKVIAEKLAPKSFNFEFDFLESRRGISKSIDRFNSLIKRAVLKRFPFLEHTTIETIGGVPGQNMFGFVSVGTVRLNPENTTTPYNKVMDRYSRFLNYQCRKYAVPGRVTATTFYEEIDSELSAYRNALLNQNVVRDEVPYPEYRKITRLNLEIGVWGMPPQHVVSPELLQMNVLPDSALAYKDFWQFDRLTHYRDTRVSSVEGRGPAASSVMFKATEKFVVAERIFMFIPQIVKTVSNLVRKTTYDYKAYSFRTDQQPAS